MCESSGELEMCGRGRRVQDGKRENMEIGGAWC